jgi:hypothetical protein
MRKNAHKKMFIMLKPKCHYKMLPSVCAHVVLDLALTSICITILKSFCKTWTISTEHMSPYQTVQTLIPQTNSMRSSVTVLETGNCGRENHYIVSKDHYQKPSINHCTPLLVFSVTLLAVVYFSLSYVHFGFCCFSVVSKYIVTCILLPDTLTKKKLQKTRVSSSERPTRQ